MRDVNRFDLEHAIQNWRAPFSVRHFYSGDDVRELEWHLRDAVADEMAEGLSEQEAFWLAVSRVGDESLLRSQYRQSWKDANPFKRYWRRLRAELSGLGSRTGRSIYVITRMYSLVAGVMAIVYLIAVPVWLSRGLPFWNAGQPLITQGMVFLTVLGFLAFFNLIPFERWENRIQNWLRIGHTALLVVLMSVYIPAGIGSDPFAWAYMIFPVSFILIGPVLWMSQLFGRRDVPVPLAEQLHELEASG